MEIASAQRTRIADICQRYHVRRMSLFGSMATGAQRPDSDVDLLVEFIPGEAPSGFGLVDMQQELVAAFGGRAVDLAFPSVLRNPYRRRAIEAQLQPLYQ
jgi:predicted nucleotidyltransferase